MPTHVTKPLSFLKGRRLRGTRLDSCGRPVYGQDSQVMTKGFITVGYTAQTTDTDEINVTNAAGEVCIYEAAVTQLVGYGVEIQFCNVDPELLSLMTGQPVVLGADGNTVIGFDIDTKIALNKTYFALEVWAGVPATGTCVAGSTGSFGYILLPFVSGGILGDFSVENGAVTFTLTGAKTKEGNAWGVGPYQDIMLNAAGSTPQAMQTPVSTSTAMRVINVDLAPPEPRDGLRPLMDPTKPALTSIAFVKGANAQTANFTTTPAATAPVYWDFGDGTWDYVAAPGTTSHVYPTGAGTYVAKATQNGVTRSVTVTTPIP